jgi:hypothetical protein
MLRPYWITLERITEPSPLNLGVGITARSESDARALFEQAWGTEYRIEIIEAVDDMRSIEQNHVAPNMGNHMVRGIWFPLGHEDR